MEILVGVLLVLAFPIIAIVGLVLAISTRDQVRRLEERLAAVEQGAASAPAGAAPLPLTPASPRGAPATEPPEPAAAATPAPPPQRADEPRATGSVPPTPPEPPPPEPRPPRISWEERFGTQWTIWVGGLALALGGFFMVRLSIEQGWFGPPVRVALGALLAVLFIAAGEGTRRRENLGSMIRPPRAPIPSTLTAAGTAVAYAVVYAAYALYHFIGPGEAFVLLGLVAIATLAAALLHGPAMAGLGLIGAYVTPSIVASDTPNYWALYLYLAVVTAAAFGLARARLWRWLAVTAVLFGFFWTLPGIALPSNEWLAAHLFHAAAGFLLAAALIVAGLLFGPDAAPGRLEPLSSGSLASYLLAATLLAIASEHDTLALGVFTALVAATLAIAWRTDSAVAAVPAAGVMVALVFAQFAVYPAWEHLVAPSGPTRGVVPEPGTVLFGTHLALGAGFAALFGGAGFAAQGRAIKPLVPMLWAAAAVFVPVAVLVALYHRIHGYAQSLPFAGLALLLATLFALATEALTRRAPRPGLAAAGAIFAAGAIAALALALTLALEKGWLTVALALMVPGIAYVADKRPLPALRWLAATMVVVVLARVAWEPRIVGADLGATPILNWLLWGYGVPAAAFWLGGHLLRRRADDSRARMADAAALLFAVLLVFLEIRHYMTGGNLYQTHSTLAEIALDVSVGLAMTIGLEWLRRRSRSIVHDVGALVIAALTLLAIVFGLGIAGNPLIFPDRVGGPFLNLILLGYGLPVLLAAALALMTRGHRPQLYGQISAVVAVSLAIVYLSFEVRRFYHGAVLAYGVTSDAEQYTYSAVWLAFGVVLLALGAGLRSRAVRLASAAVVIVTVLKVFLIDMRDLTGILQAMSFIGLGAVLIAIGWLYQRLLFPRPAAAVAPPGFR